MNQRGYAVAFGLVLLALCLGAYFGGSYIYQRVTGARNATVTWTPPETRTAEAGETPALAAQAATATQRPAAGASTAPTSRPLPTLRAILTPFVPPTATFAPTETPAPATPTVIAVAVTTTVTVTPTVVAKGQFVLTGSVRATSGDCSGNLILGRVVNAAGVPMPGVRLHLTDEYGAENTVKETKAEQVDLGRYDFPLSGPGRTYYLVVEDAAGQPISERIAVAHGVGPNPKASCHWADWQQR